MKGRRLVAMSASLVVVATACGDSPVTPQITLDCGTTQAPTPVTLSAGEAFFALEPTDPLCLELTDASGRYIVTVLNTSTSPGATAAFQFRGAGAGAAIVTSAAAEPLVGAASLSLAAQPDDVLGIEMRHRMAHRHMLARNLRFMETMPARTHPTMPGFAQSTVGANVSLQVGETSTIRMPDIDSEATLCSQLPHEPAEVRTVYVGTRSVIVEDTEAPLAGTMDSYFAAIGQEFDDVMWPILTGNFGNPIVLDDVLDDNDRVVMVFSQRVNAFDLGVAGFVINCDFFAQTDVPSSNEGEYFYAIVPTSSATGFSGLTRDNWRRVMRAVIIHEVKHITSFAERLSRSHPPEQNWLEEATAMIAEELWARQIYGVEWKGNVTYDESLYCDVRPTFPECADAPSVMFSHFALLYDYMSDVEQLSPLGDPPGQSGSTFYGSGWSLVRWAIDHYATSESAFLLPLTQGPLIGVSNVEARTGRPWREMQADWVLTNAVDDRTGFTAQRSQLRHPSWQYRDIFARMRADFPSVFSRMYPLQPQSITFGSFSQNVPSVAGGTAAYFELTGTLSGGQLLEVRAMNGGPPPQALRLAVVRVQ